MGNFKNFYVKPGEFRAEYNKSLEEGKPTHNLILMLEKIAKKYALKPIFIYVNKCDYDACVNFALIRAWEKWDKFNYEISDNIFAYFTKIISNDLKIHYNKLMKGKKNNISIDALFDNNNN